MLRPLMFAMTVLVVAPWGVEFAQAEWKVRRGSPGIPHGPEPGRSPPSPDEARVARQQSSGGAFGRNGEAREAIANLRAALSVARNGAARASIARELIDAATAAGDGEAEIEGRRMWAQLRPGPASATNLAAALARAGRFREAATTLAAVGHARRTDQAVAGRALDEGRYWAAAGELQAAREALMRARDSAPAGATQLRRDVLAALLDVARRQGDLESLARSLAHPRDVVEWEAKAAVAAEEGDSRSAWQALDEAIRRRPDDIELHRRRIAAARRVGTAGEIAHLLEGLAAVAQKNFDAAAVGEALDGLWRLGRPDLASVAFDRLLVRANTSTDLVRTAAELAARWDDDRRAERGWRALLRRHPGDESAIVALGEVRLQRGDRRGALEAWRSLLRTSSSPAEAHARLAETLADHEIDEPAIAEAQAAISLAPRRTRYWRVLAGILERQSKGRDAQEAWENVLRLGRGPAGIAERREARTHLVTLWIRDGSARVATKLAELEEYLREQPGDEDVRLCLVEAYLRTERPDAARRLLKQMWAGASVTDGDAPVDLVFALIKVLRQRQRTAEAMTWLEEIATRFPARAREARLQLAEMALAEREDDRALSFASAAVEAAPDDVVVAMRAGAIEERTGDLEAAMKTYRRATGLGTDPAGALALAALMARTGVDAQEQRALLRGALLRGTDEDLLTDAGRRAIVLEEGMGSLEELAMQLADAADLNVSHPGGPARRRILASVLTRLVPAAYRLREDDPAAATRLRRYGRDGVRPLLELAATGEAEVDVSAINALGMLGHAESAAELSRLLVADEPPGGTRPREIHPTGLASPSFELKAANSDVVRAIVVALGRLGGDVARTTLESVARLQHPALGVPVLWSLGRVGSPLGTELASRELSRASTDTAVIACLTLGRAGGADAATILTEVATDPGRAATLRAAAVIGLSVRGAMGAHAGGSTLRQLAQNDDGLVAEAARVGLTMHSRGETRLPDDGILISGSSIEPEALVRDLIGAMARRYSPSRRSAP